MPVDVDIYLAGTTRRKETGVNLARLITWKPKPCLGSFLANFPPLTFLLVQFPSRSILWDTPNSHFHTVGQQAKMFPFCLLFGAPFSPLGEFSFCFSRTPQNFHVL
jgi:hypothetical protein